MSRVTMPAARKVAPIDADASLLYGVDATSPGIERQTSFRSGTQAILEAHRAPHAGRSVVAIVAAFSVVAFVAFALFPAGDETDLLAAPRVVAPNIPESSARRRPFFYASGASISDGRAGTTRRS